MGLPEPDLPRFHGAAQVEIRTSKVQTVIGEYAVGRGLFACQDFAMNEIITVYGGELITTEEAR